MASRLSLYNGALLECGERDLASLSENREPRRLLDRVWDNGLVDFALEQGQWKFAKRTVVLAPETGVETGFGHKNTFTRPDDHVKTIGIWSDEYLQSPLLQYQQEGQKWFADVEEFYISYVSNGASYGGDLGSWPAGFARAVELYLASRIVKRLTQDEDAERLLIAKARDAFTAARSDDAMEGPTTFPPPGRWVRARRGSRSTDGGSRTRLTE